MDNLKAFLRKGSLGSHQQLNVQKYGQETRTNPFTLIRSPSQNTGGETSNSVTNFGDGKRQRVDGDAYFYIICFRGRTYCNMGLVGEMPLLVHISLWLGMIFVFGPVLFLVAVCLPQAPVRLIKRFYATNMA